MNFDIPNPDGPFPFPQPEPFPPFPFPFPEPGPWPPQQRWRIPELEKIKWPIKYGPAQVRILIVTDGATFDTANGFGLGVMLRDAFNVGTAPGTPLPADYPDYARFDFSLQTRSSMASTAPGFSGFSFSDASLAGFHEVWLFGVSTAAPYLQGLELAALTKFMNDGGGVLAMGDHEDLGLGLCGNVPRVKSMRKWWYDLPLPPGEQRAPDSTNLTRNDTVQLIPPMNSDPGTGGQSDSLPQTIYPNYRFGHNWWHPHRFFRYPHPVLCGPRGAITVFPDHAHEGDCIVPAVLDAVEYPGGVAPEVIARGRNVVGRTKGGFTITDPREFGLLGAYDGHVAAANVGRALVDSTWHHWFNINLVGLNATPHSVAYKDILAYFRNVAVWLAPKERQKRMRLTGQVILLFATSMIERTLTIRDLRPELFYYIGIEARDALGRIAPQCQANIWFIELLSPFLPKLIDRVTQLNPKEVPGEWEVYAQDRVLMTALGGAISSLAIAARQSDYREGDKVIEAADEIASKGIQAGIEFAMKDLAENAKRASIAFDGVTRLSKR
jgi:hypothetical protein